jgi:hypothetical protein
MSTRVAVLAERHQQLHPVGAVRLHARAVMDLKQVVL